MPSIRYYIGEVFGKFKIIKDLGMKYPTENSIGRVHYVKAKCQSCGKTRKGMINAIRQKGTKCDCEKRPLTTKEWKRLYKIHLGMISRCYDKKSKDYKNYGKKGIKICNEWKYSFVKFYEWSLKNNYSTYLSIDRINNQKGYSPENCRWATRSQQQQNKRTSIPISVVKKVKTLLKEGYTRSEISKMTHHSYGRVKHIHISNHWNYVD
jgi:hypothetical protein